MKPKKPKLTQKLALKDTTALPEKKPVGRPKLQKNREKTDLNILKQSLLLDNVEELIKGKAPPGAIGPGR